MTSLPPNTCQLEKLTLLLFYADEQDVKETNRMEKQLRAHFAGTQLFKINIRTNPKMGASFRVQETPLVLALHEGKEIWRQANPFSEAGMLFSLLPQNQQQQNEKAGG